MSKKRTKRRKRGSLRNKSRKREEKKSTLKSSKVFYRKIFKDIENHWIIILNLLATLLTLHSVILKITVALLSLAAALIKIIIDYPDLLKIVSTLIGGII